MVKTFSCAFVFSCMAVFFVCAQETAAQDEPPAPPSRITEAQKLQAQQNLTQEIDTLLKNREPQQMKRILKASEVVEKNQVRRKNRFLPKDKQIRYQEKNLDVRNKKALKNYFNETYVVEPTLPETSPAPTEAQ